MYSKNSVCKLLTRQEAVETFNLSPYMIDKVARECGTKLKIGRAARYHQDVLQRYIETLTCDA